MVAGLILLARAVHVLSILESVEDGGRSVGLPKALSLPDTA